MAHELEIVDGQAAFCFTGDRKNIWHRLGTEVSDEITPEGMMKAAGVDWTVSKQPLFMQDVKGNKIETEQCALVRDSDNKILDYVSDGWNPVQNQQAFEFFNDFIANGNMKMDSAGSLHGGRIVWANAKLSGGFDLFGGDTIEGYLLFSNPHQFGRGINVRNVMTRTVCQNTLSMALTENNKKRYSQSHATVFSADAVKRALGMADAQLQEFRKSAEFLGQKLYTVDQMKEYFTKVFPKTTDSEGISKNAELAQSVVTTQPGAQFAEGSFWQLLNAVTYVNTNLAGRSDDTRAMSNLYGQNSIKSQQALKLALEMA